MPLIELVGHTPVPPVVDGDRLAVPVVQFTAHAGADWTWQPTGETVSIERTMARGRQLQAIKVEGDCMIPALEPDDLVIYDQWSREPNDGDMVVVTRDSQTHVRWVRVRRPGARPQLVDNFGRPFPLDGETTIEGIVIERRTIRPRRRQWHDLEDDPETE